MIVGLYQTPSPKGDLAEGLRVLEAAMAAAADSGVQMLVLPECFLPGYGAVTPEAPDGWETVPGQIAALCRAHGLALTIGLPEFDAGRVHNAAFVFDETGAILARHRKTQLFGAAEQALYTPGEALTHFDYRGKRFGLLICYEVEFPELVRPLAQAGIDVLLVPTANMKPYLNVTQFLVPARATENAITVVYANYCGSEGDLDYVGMSGIFGPDGYSLGSKGTGPGLCLAKLPEGWSEHGVPYATQLQDLALLPE